MHWLAKYIGFPYREGGRGVGGVDCWGLLYLVYPNEFGIVLPDMPGISAETVIVRDCTMEAQVLQDWTEILVPEDGCAVAMSRSRVIHHVGIWAAADGGKVVHSWKHQLVVADTIRTLRLKGIRTIKFYRHRQWKL